MKANICNLYRSFIFLSVGMISTGSAFAQSETKTYQNKDYKVVYTVTNGMLNGTYTSFYKNGIKKAEGTYAFNNRLGDWKAYDSTGRLKMERVYTNSYEFASVIPAAHPDSIPYTPKRNADGFYDYFALKQTMVVEQSRIWQYVFIEENPFLTGLFKLLYDKATHGQIQAEKPKPTDPLTMWGEPINFTNTPLDTTGIDIIGYKIYGDWFYDDVRNLSEYRVIGICPIAKRSGKLDQYVSANFARSNKDTVDLFWVYMRAARQYLATEKISSMNLPANIQNEDDIFFWHYYAGHVLSTQSGYEHWSPSLYKKGTGILDVIEIEAEHNIWLKPRALPRVF
ncbi:MAG TPA: hypothetical protein VNZ45_04565 [Bacteroidia bacterium]|jgi:hypothetical protein|nr:hypothetical protein [Bacteroidia bacterium]